MQKIKLGLYKLKRTFNKELYNERKSLYTDNADFVLVIDILENNLVYKTWKTKKYFPTNKFLDYFEFDKEVDYDL